MFKHLLVPIDGSPTSQLAVDKAIGLAGAFSSAVSVLYVIDPYPFAGVGADFAYGQTQYLSAARAEANEALAQARRAFEAAGIQASASLVESHAVWRGIIEAAEAGGGGVVHVSVADRGHDAPGTGQLLNKWGQQVRDRRGGQK